MPDRDTANATLTLYPEGIQEFVRAQINELVGDQLRGATEDGYRLGLRSAVTLAEGLGGHPDTDPRQCAVLDALVAVLNAAADNVCLFGPAPADTAQEGQQ